MVFKKLSEEDKIIIKLLRQKFGYGAKKIIKDHPEKNWGLRNVGYLLKKNDETGDVKRREGSGRPKSSRTESNINAIKELISSKEEKAWNTCYAQRDIKNDGYSTYFDQKNNCRKP